MQIGGIEMCKGGLGLTTDRAIQTFIKSIFTRMILGVHKIQLEMG